MGIAAGHEELRHDRARQLDIDLLTDVRRCGAAGDARNRRAAGVVEGVVSIGEPPGMVAGGDRPSAKWCDLEAGASMANVAPSDLIGEAQLVVAGRIQLIERPARAVGGVGVAGSPGKDEECASAGLAKVQQALQ